MKHEKKELTLRLSSIYCKYVGLVRVIQYIEEEININTSDAINVEIKHFCFMSILTMLPEVKGEKKKTE